MAACVRITGARAATTGWHGVNLIRTPGSPFGGEACAQSFSALKALGVDSVALVFFLWQARPDSNKVVLGNDYTLDELADGIRQAHSFGFKVMVKVHVWVPGTWAGAIAAVDEAGWGQWFASYGDQLERLAAVAAQQKAESLALGTELKGTSSRPEWPDLIRRVRSRFGGQLSYVAHWDGEFSAVPFWGLLDLALVSLYPPLGDSAASADRTITEFADRLVALGRQTGKPVGVGEVGLRSASGANERPWEGAEERQAVPDPALQAWVLARWLAAFEERHIGDVLIWRWFTDPQSGGPTDTDFTIQNKEAEKVIGCWTSDACEVRGIAPLFPTP